MLSNEPGLPRHPGGLSTLIAGLGFVGLERQRSFASVTLRGVDRAAAFVLRRMLAGTRRGR
ncbi:hypothetical protein [Actinoplanes regularis]|uniref:hypothetical protein n=1 Tax=Actinoplanes regularis TaxID=52697 RepID=UPI000B791265|nr:hypothetical protein [Actinoplanes regularis]GIE85656.1 hypothetical protein Are01nite_21360 [Actinoplanes regularis]